MAKVVNVTTNSVPTGTSFPALVLDGNYVAAGSTKTLDYTDNRACVKLDTASGSTVTLPASLGTGTKYRFVVTTLATSNSHVVKVANSTDVMVGVIHGFRADSGNAVLGFGTVSGGSASDTITLNRTTTGSVNLGEWIEVEDVAAGVWAVRGSLASTGAAFATPFSSAV